MTLESRFESPGTLRKPGPIGRGIRLLVGIWALYALLTFLAGAERFLSTEAPTHSSFWLAVAIAFYAFPYVVNIGFTRSWGRKPQYMILVATALAAGWSLVQYGSLWAPPLGALLLVWLLYVFGHLGVSLVLASAIATPGCEMRAIPHLWTLLTGRATYEHYCPGMFNPIDRWEANLSSRAS